MPTNIRGSDNFDSALAGTPIGFSFAVNNVTGTGAGTFPHTVAIPKQTDGNEILTLTYTPKRSNSVLIIDVTTMFGEVSNTGNHGVACLFKDSALDAIACGECVSAGDVNTLSHGTVTFRHVEVAGNTTARIYKLRVGVDVGSVRWNGYGATQYYGTSNKTTISITEIAQ